MATSTTTARLSSFFADPPRLLRCLDPRKTSLRRPTPKMVWTCTKCTFHNPSPATSSSSCHICGSHFSSSSSSSSSAATISPPRAPKWSCKACTFLNPFGNTRCEICATSVSVSSLSRFQELSSTEPEEALDSSVGSVFFPLQRCKRKARDAVEDDGADHGAFRGVKASSSASVTVPEDTNATASLNTMKILTYNVWFREDLEMHKRMKAIGDLIQLHSPDVICFQEVTSNIYDAFQLSSWWKKYKCSVSSTRANTEMYFCMQLSKLPVNSFRCKPFSNSVMGRELSIAEVVTEANKSLIVATSHLESPCPAPPKWDQMYSKERVDQAKEALDLLKENPNVIFCGDMNWDDKLDGHFPLPEGWVDAWTELRPGDIGWTYDTKSNQMLSGNRALQRRLDRCVCCLHDFELNGIEMIGMEAIPGVSYCKEKKVKKEKRQLLLPVLPSDHYGLLLTINRL